MAGKVFGEAYSLRNLDRDEEVPGLLAKVNLQAAADPAAARDMSLLDAYCLSPLRANVDQHLRRLATECPAVHQRLQQAGLRRDEIASLCLWCGAGMGVIGAVTMPIAGGQPGALQWVAPLVRNLESALMKMQHSGLFVPAADQRYFIRGAIGDQQFSLGSPKPGTLCHLGAPVATSPAAHEDDCAGSFSRFPHDASYDPDRIVEWIFVRCGSLGVDLTEIKRAWFGHGVREVIFPFAHSAYRVDTDGVEPRHLWQPGSGAQPGSMRVVRAQLCRVNDDQRRALEAIVGRVAGYAVRIETVEPAAPEPSAAAGIANPPPRSAIPICPPMSFPYRIQPG
ncbi:hypothetical protein [Trinickia acidisoli]|uniref:hypothetical protein n=1 Tax=Trinickia acidisoli TaxID=2767482 RepID=UPI001A8E5CA3|nr:hypothetical protein [Trinickia acidisoli]